MSEQPPPPPPPPHNPSPMGGPPPPLGVPRPGELLDRFLAALIDGVIIGVVFGIVNAISASIFLAGFTNSVGELLIYWAVTAIIATVFALGYFGFMESNSGQTLGKMVMKLKVVGPDGVSNPTMEQAVRRHIYYAGYLAFIVPVIGWLLGLLAIMVGVIMIAVGINNDTVNRQAWHDKFAGGTRVLKIG